MIDVRTGDEHMTGFIPGTDGNIDFREIGRRHVEIGAGSTIILSCIVNPATGATPPPKHWLGWGTNMYIMSRGA